MGSQLKMWVNSTFIFLLTWVQIIFVVRSSFKKVQHDLGWIAQVEVFVVKL